MTREQLIAQALASWIQEKLASERDIAREGLPAMDVGYFLKALALLEAFPSSDFSIALAGFGHSTTALRSLANKAGLKSIRDIADDFNAAAAWRNNRRNHRRILALARGRHPGVHTLKHFAPPHSRELARAVLEWAILNGDIASTGAQRNLLQMLANSLQLEPLRSLELVADFLAAWSQLTQTDPNDAPRQALPQLGLLADPALFTKPDALEIRLVRNLETSAQLMDAAPTMLRQRRAQIEK